MNRQRKRKAACIRRVKDLFLTEKLRVQVIFLPQKSGLILLFLAGKLRVEGGVRLAEASIRQHTSAYVSIRCALKEACDSLRPLLERYVRRY